MSAYSITSLPSSIFARMNCLVIAATPFEIAPLLDRYTQPRSFQHDIDVLITGVGLMACTYSLQKQIQIKKPDLIIQAGIAGCFDNNMPLTRVVAISKDTIADQGVTEQQVPRTIFELGLAAADGFPYKKGWLVNPHRSLIKETGLSTAAAISINQVSTSAETINAYRKKFRPLVESMEGAALHYVALREKIPFLQLRSISNYIGERDKQKWKIKESIVRLNKELGRVLSTL